MGYTTEFTGRFDCYRVENPMMGEFLRAIRAGDSTSLPGFADWLIDQGDPRGAQISKWLATGAENGRDFWSLFGLRPEHGAYLRQFNKTRRMKRDAKLAATLPDPNREAVDLRVGAEGAYFVGGSGFMGQDDDASVKDHNKPPRGQPGLWCQWTPTADATGIEWDQGEKFYEYIKWLEYLVKHFLAPWNYIVNGEVKWQGEEDDDFGTLVVTENVVTIRPFG